MAFVALKRYLETTKGSQMFALKQDLTKVDKEIEEIKIEITELLP